MELQLHPFLTPVLDGSEWSASRPELFNPRYKFNRKLGGPQNRYVHFGEDKYTLPLLRFEFRIGQDLALPTIPTELPLLSTMQIQFQ